jgi:DNA-binding winged helix-turn-helix (wHTH) protein
VRGVIFRFGGVEVDERRFELRHDGKVVPVQRRVLETLLFLIHSGGRLVTKSDLLEGPWRGSVVTDAAFAQAIMLARRALGAGGRSGAVITTVRGKGFRLDVAQVPAVDRHHVQGVASEKAQRGAPLPVKPSARSAVSGRTRERLELAKRLVELADHDADDALGLDARLLALQALMRIGDGARTDVAAAEYLSLAERKGAPRHLFFASIVESTRSFRAGDIALAASALKRALAMSTSVGSDADRIVAVHLVNLALEQRGRERRRSLELARGLATKVLRRTPELALGGSLFAVTALQLADRPQALRHFRELASRVGDLPLDRYFTATLVGLSDLAIAFRDASL